MGILFSQFMNAVKVNGFNVVFVPMYGDSFFTKINVYSFIAEKMEVFVPMYGDSFFTFTGNVERSIQICFRPHVWGFFFHSRPGRPHRMGSLLPFFGGDFQLVWILIFSSR